VRLGLVELNDDRTIRVGPGCNVSDDLGLKLTELRFKIPSECAANERGWERIEVHVMSGKRV
jgi:hypothetical protein